MDSEQGDDEPDEDDATSRKSRPSAPPGSLWDCLEGQPRDRLLELLKEAADLSVAVRYRLESQFQVQTGQVGRTVTAARREIAELGTGSGRREWGREYAGAPNLEPLKARLLALLQAGCSSELLKLGEELLGVSDKLIESCDEEGEFASELEDCLAVVFKGLAHSDLLPAEQLQWLLTLGGTSQYEIAGSGERAFWETDRSREGWHGLATALLLALNDPDEDTVSGFRRDGLVDRTVQALEKAGREDEIIPLCEREAERTGRYDRLVDQFIAAHRWKEAERWCRQGIEGGFEQRSWTGSKLRDRLRTIYEGMDRKQLVAALRAEEFFETPSAESFAELIAEAERIGARPAVDAWARYYLETGQRPRSAGGTGGGADRKPTSTAGAGKSSNNLPPWPLPDPELPRGKEPEPAAIPMVQPLLEIAIQEHNADEVLRWYDHPRWTKSRFSQPPHTLVAQAVGDKYPNRAIAIWKKLTEDALTETGERAYQAAGNALRPLRELIIRHKREAEWKEYLSGIRAQHRRKRNLMPILDRLESGDRPIVET